MTELIEIMFWFGSERNVRWSDDSRREYEWSQRKGRLHDYQIKYASTRQGLLANAALAFDALDIEFGFWLDSAASDKNALCAHWLTEADDALNSEWVSHGAIWNNPPYSNIRPWVEKSR